MPILLKSESLPKRPVVIVIYGEPGIGKTSLFNTSDNPLLIDFDRGVDRSIFRQDTLIANTWNDVISEEASGSFANYSTIGIDTAKAALDDFLMSYVIKLDYSAAKNKLKAYGAIGDEFKLFVSNRRSENADLVIIAHAKDEKEGDVIKKIPDVTGQSYNLLLRIADQVGYMRTINNKRTIQWEPTDTTIGKNVARLTTTEIPNETDPAFKNYMALIISSVKEAISTMSEAQKEALEKIELFTNQVLSCTDPADLTALLTVINELPKTHSLALRKIVSDRSKELGFIVDKESKAFVNPAPAPNPIHPEYHVPDPAVSQNPIDYSSQRPPLTQSITNGKLPLQ